MRPLKEIPRNGCFASDEEETADEEEESEGRSPSVRRGRTRDAGASSGARRMKSDLQVAYRKSPKVRTPDFGGRIDYARR